MENILGWCLPTIHTSTQGGLVSKHCRITEQNFFTIKFEINQWLISTQYIGHPTHAIMTYKIRHPDQINHLDFAYSSQREVSVTRRKSHDEACLYCSTNSWASWSRLQEFKPSGNCPKILRTSVFLRFLSRGIYAFTWDICM